MNNRCCRIHPWHRRWYHHPAVQAAGTAALIFTAVVLCALILHAYGLAGPAQDAWSVAERERAAADWGGPLTAAVPVGMMLP